MFKKIGLMGITLGALLLSGCGSSGGNSDPMNNKNYVAIITNVEPGLCESDALRNELASVGLTGLLIRETDNTTNCGTYDKINDGNQCAIENIGTGTRNCVVGFDNAPEGFGEFARQISPVSLDETIELISGNF